jgi:hypothetical protein
VTDREDLVLVLILAVSMPFYYIRIITAEGIQYQPQRGEMGTGNGFQSIQRASEDLRKTPLLILSKVNFFLQLVLITLSSDA